MLKNGKFLTIGLAALWLAANLAAEPSAEAPVEELPVDGTVITSHSLNYDQTARMAVFDRDVVVTDPQLQIMADRLTVFFAEDNQVQRLQAEGDVRIRQRELSATGNHADYDVLEGRVVLSGNPRVVRGRDILQGEQITFWRDSSRILSEPNARLVLYSERDMLTGATSVPDK